MNKPEDTIFSSQYLKWVAQSNFPPLTNTQHKFVEWLLLKENAKVITQIGNLDTIFVSVRKWAKENMKELLDDDK